MLRLRAKEVMDIAVKIEKNGSAFYDTLVASTTNAKAKAVYEFMAGEERQHIVNFQALGEGLESDQDVETYAGEHDTYLEAVASTHMFVEDGVGAKLAKQAADDADAIRVAMQFEKDSVLLFDALKPLVPPKEKPRVDALINQEKGHMIKLAQLAVELKKA